MNSKILRGIIISCIIAGIFVFLPSSAFALTETLRPNAAGDETSITYQYPSSTYHWDKVNEASADDAVTYISDMTGLYRRDLYNLPAHTGSGIINFIKIYIKCKTQETGYGVSAKPSLKSDSTVTDGNANYLTTSYAVYSQQWNTNPADSATWEWADIDALQIGVSLVGAEDPYNKLAYCTQVYVEVDYTPPPPPPFDALWLGGD